MYTLREPQQIVFDKIRNKIGAGKKRILVLAATGFGKTILSYVITKNALQKGNRVLFTSHRIQLAGQTKDKFSDLKPSYLQGNSKGFDRENMLQIATIQTLLNNDIEEPKIIIIDEVHYAYNSVLIQSLFTKFPNSIFIGLSATPVDDKGYLLEGFDTIIDDYQTSDLIALKWLVPFVVYSPIKIDLSGVKIKGNDYANDELEKVVNIDNINRSIVENYTKLGENRKFLCFCVNKKHAHDLQLSFYSAKIATEIITADTSDVERNAIFERFKKGETKGILNIEILTAGFDDPSVSLIILAEPSKSWKNYIQRCGRGIRLLGQSYEESVKNGKKDCIILDCSGAVLEHDLPDIRHKFEFNKKISKVLDKELKLDETQESRIEIINTISVEKQIYLKKIGSLLDLYESKIYTKESELQDDVNSFLKKTGFFWYRQNSGKAFIDGRYVHFASKSGLPDNTVFFPHTSFYFGLELKLKKGYLTEHQKVTLPEMTENKVLFFIIESVFDAYKAIEHVEKNITSNGNETIIKSSIYDLDERQTSLRNKLKLNFY